jgi:hypothetical protein
VSLSLLAATGQADGDTVLDCATGGRADGSAFHTPGRGRIIPFPGAGRYQCCTTAPGQRRFGGSAVQALTALLWIGLELSSAVHFSAAIISDSRLYGTVGVVFTLLTWFIAIGAVIVPGAAAGATRDQRKGRRPGGTNPASSGQGNDGIRPRPRAGNTP